MTESLQEGALDTPLLTPNAHLSVSDTNNQISVSETNCHANPGDHRAAMLVPRLPLLVLSGYQSGPWTTLDRGPQQQLSQIQDPEITD